MSSLMQGVLSLAVVQPPGTALTPEECLAVLDLDPDEIAAVEGGWEPVNSGPDPSRPQVHDLLPSDFEINGPSVYERNGYMIVRGTKVISKGDVLEDTPIWFVFEQSATSSSDFAPLE